MNTPRKHHFVPIFLLKEWTDKSRRLRRYLWKDGSVETAKVLPREVCAERDLYAAKGHNSAPLQIVEQKFLTPYIDTPSAAIHDLLLKKQTNFSTEQRATWTKFLMAQRARTPNVIREAQAKVIEQAKLELPDLDPEYQKLRQEDDPQTAYEFAMKHYAPYMQNTGLRIVLSLVMNEEVSELIFNMHWGVRFIDTEENCLEFLMCDRPLVIEGNLKEDETSVLHIPISPNALFFAVKRKEYFDRVVSAKPREIVHNANKRLLSQTDRFVIARSDVNFPLVQKHFKKKYGQKEN